MSKITPGPWGVGNAKKSGLTTSVYSDDSTGSAIAECRLKWVCRTQEETEANANLIAAAPDYDAVVEKFLDWNKKYPSSRIYNESEIRKIAAELDLIAGEAKNAQSKARGES